MRTWALTGPAPNPLAARCDEYLACPAPDPQVVQELHLVSVHVLCEHVDRALPSVPEPSAELPGAELPAAELPGAGAYAAAQRAGRRDGQGARMGVLTGPVNGTATANGNGNGNGNGAHAHDPNLFVLGTGPVPPNPGEFVGSPALEHILNELARRFDTVLIDAPPALQVGDAMTVSAKADGLLIVARMNVVRRPMLAELHRLLAASPAHKLGFILTGAQNEDGYGNDGYYGYYGVTSKPERDRDASPVA
jgi:hypothetical protein